MNKYRIALLGNPNVGKSTIYNYLCKENQHTGNWAGKTVDSAIGTFMYNDNLYEVVDLPGIYSLNTCSDEEVISKQYLESKEYDLVVVVIDAYVIERSLLLYQQVCDITSNVLLVINLYDEAIKRGMYIDRSKLLEYLPYPHVIMSAKNKGDMEYLKSYMCSLLPFTSNRQIDINIPILLKECITQDIRKQANIIDKVLTHRVLGPIIMFLTLLTILYLTIVLANYPSSLLSYIFSKGEILLISILNMIGSSNWLIDLIVNYIYRILSLVIAVMLPPMVIFFPLFALLEDIGYLPRIAFNLDYYFQKVGASGKQALTICMGYGCNVVGIMGSRIIESQKERILAMITNVFTPCNGRFPTLIAIISMFLVSSVSSWKSALLLAVTLCFSLIITFLGTEGLRRLLKYPKDNEYILELTPYRTPDLKQILKDSLFNKTFKIMLRAVLVVIPTSILIYVGEHIIISNASILQHVCSVLEPIGNLMGMDGVMLVSFIIGMMANEIVLPICIMLYSSYGIVSDYSLVFLKELLITNGWTLTTALCALIFTVIHFPCINAVIAIYKETKSLKYTLLSIVYPTVIGVVLCVFINALMQLIW
ncbi:MAG: ferrous iron transporter B [Erysipelotrichales bacterium]|nr:ferrous iron transporter B [Erysipelotrichales bacterium]